MTKQNTLNNSKISEGHREILNNQSLNKSAPEAIAGM